MLSNQFKILLFTFFALFCIQNANAQSSGAQNLIIAGITVEGNVFADEQTVISLSGLRLGESFQYPGDTKIQNAIKNIWNRKQFSDVEIILDKKTSLGAFLVIKVKEFERINKITILNNEEIEADKIKKAIGKTEKEILAPYDIYLIKENIKKLYQKEGLIFAAVEVERQKTDTAHYTNLIIKIKEGKEFKIAKIDFEGNNSFSDSKLAGEFKETHEKKWWKFWESAKLNLKEFEKDKENIVKFYNKSGFRDAEWVKDTIIFDEKENVATIKVWVNEGKRYFIRNITFEGNTIYKSETLLARLEFQKGDPYDYEKFQSNLRGNESQSDAISLYLDNGYLFAQPNIEENRVEPDSMDVNIKITEGTRVTINKVNIVGNTKTKDKIIRRELYTRPGDYFSRSSVIRSVRALGMLNYFNPEALKPNVVPSSDNTKVDVEYKVEERSTDTFNASIGYAGTFGLTLAIGLSFNNFDIMRPLQGGGGQVFNFQWEMGQGNRYQTLSVGVTEPWLFDEPTTVGFNIYDTKYNYYYNLQRTGVQLNLGRRFHWPDDYFRGDWSLGATAIDAGTSNSTYYRAGKTSEFTISQTFSRVSLNNMYFPTSGSKFSLSTVFAMGALGIGTADYIKNQFKFEMNQPLFTYKDNDRLILHLNTTLGYMTGFKSDTTFNPIELYSMGGNGLSGFGVTPLRGYDDRAIAYNGGKVMIKHTAELRFAVSLDPMPVFLYGFAEAGNVWTGLKETDPFDLKRSAGVGVQLLLNPIGIIGFSYGYGFDSPSYGVEKPGWKFLFHLGNNF